MRPLIDTAASGLTHPKYRPDIDGLRAVAILSVLAFHAFPASLPGGFIGVDIFFVISGYLISTIIFGSLEGNRFSITSFYGRRIRRIFPALLTVLIACYAFGWFALFPDEFTLLHKHQIGGASFISNLLLWRESGYFDTAAESKPLLHLWSLAVEEQFYIFWPLMLWFVWRRRWSFLALTGAIAVASFVVNVSLVHGNPTAAFYSPLSRFWELMVGGVLAYLRLHNRVPDGRFANWQAIAGLALLAIGMVSINEQRAFPGWWALLPTVGSFLVISAGPAAWINQKLLSNRLMVGVGLISYPLYLWHWPLLSYLRIVKGSAPRPVAIIVAVALAFLLAWLTFVLLERPIRDGRFGERKKVAIALGATMAFVLVGSALGYVRKFSPHYTNPQLQAVISPAGSWEYLQKLKTDELTRKGIYHIDSTLPDITLFIGDSHVAQYAPRIGRVVQNNLSTANTVYIGVRAGCPPIPNVMSDMTDGEQCRQMRKAWFDLVEKQNVKVVVIGAMWNAYFIYHIGYPKLKPADPDYYALRDGVRHEFRNGSGKQVAMVELEGLLRSLGRTKQVYLLLDNPQDEGFDPHVFMNANRFGSDAGAATHQAIARDVTQARLQEELTALAARAGAEVIDPVALLCEAGSCERVTADGKPIYADNNHLHPDWIRDKASFLDTAIVRQIAKKPGIP